MALADERVLRGLIKGRSSTRASADDLQGLLLQVVLALLMVFMIAYFIFVDDTRRKEEEQVLDVNRQKLVLALDKTMEDQRVRYGLNALMIQGTDGKRTFDADAHIHQGKLVWSQAVKVAFQSGSKAAQEDYKDVVKLQSLWCTNVLSAANLAVENLQAAEIAWLEQEVSRRIEETRLDVRGAQRALAARVTQNLAEHPEMFANVQDPASLAAALKVKALEILRNETGVEVLP